MYVFALATDYDGTIAEHGTLAQSTAEALTRFKSTGRRLVLVTGRVLPDLRRVLPEIGLFDRVVAENGALLYDPRTDTEKPLAPPPPDIFVQRLRQRDVGPLDVGRSIIATWQPHEKTVLEVIQELGLELQIIFNKGAVMVLPSGINKATGLAAALVDLGLSPLNVVGVGDAENDHAFLNACGCAAAVANALPMVKEGADIRLTRDHGAGVVDLLEQICRDDARLMPVGRHAITLGADRDEQSVDLSPFDGSVLIAGSSGIGKSTLATALTERMVEKQIEFCVFDPEGDYSRLENAISIGDGSNAPRLEEANELLRHLGTNFVLNTQSLEVADRPAFFVELMNHVETLRAATGRPHWLVIDEAHHLLPVARDDVARALADKMSPAVLITVHPESMSPLALGKVEVVVALGSTAEKVLADFCAALHVAAPTVGQARASDEEVLVWQRSTGRPPRWVKPLRPHQAHKRHTRKYAEGDLGVERSFFFRGPDKALNLRAQNLMLFLQIAEGVDDRTWEHHLRAGDYSRWFAREIKNGELSEETAAIEADQSLDAAESRRRIHDAVMRRYTSPEKVEAEHIMTAAPAPPPAPSAPRTRKSAADARSG